MNSNSDEVYNSNTPKFALNSPKELEVSLRKKKDD
jgi:hypothetical protein